MSSAIRYRPTSSATDPETEIQGPHVTCTSLHVLVLWPVTEFAPHVSGQVAASGSRLRCRTGRYGARLRHRRSGPHSSGSHLLNRACRLEQQLHRGESPQSYPSAAPATRRPDISGRVMTLATSSGCSSRHPDEQALNGLCFPRPAREGNPVGMLMIRGCAVATENLLSSPRPPAPLWSGIATNLTVRLVGEKNPVRCLQRSASRHRIPDRGHRSRRMHG